MCNVWLLYVLGIGSHTHAKQVPVRHKANNAEIGQWTRKATQKNKQNEIRNKDVFFLSHES